MFEIGIGSEIHPTANISPNLRVSIGKYCKIGPQVEFVALENHGHVVIGDCARIGAGNRFLVGNQGLHIGDWSVIHETSLFVCRGLMHIGHNFWLGRHALMDSTGGLIIGHGVRIGAYSQVWTHVSSGELLEGSLLASSRSTTLEDDVWLVGSCIVGSGVTIGKKAVCLIGSVVTKSLYQGCVYSGVPAVQNWKMEAWRKVDGNERISMMETWANQFAESSGATVLREEKSVIVVRDGEFLVFSLDAPTELQPNTTWFNLLTKLYNKRLSNLEREMYSFLYGNKARFIPVEMP